MFFERRVKKVFSHHTGIGTRKLGLRRKKDLTSLHGRMSAKGQRRNLASPESITSSARAMWPRCRVRWRLVTDSLFLSFDLNRMR
jgi:hypothetical protein